MADLRCLDCNTDTGVEYRSTPDRDDFKSFPRCEPCFGRRLESASRTLELLSDCVPSWFDPSYAGERWDEDY